MARRSNAILLALALALTAFLSTAFATVTAMAPPTCPSGYTQYAERHIYPPHGGVLTTLSTKKVTFSACVALASSASTAAAGFTWKQSSTTPLGVCIGAPAGSKVSLSKKFKSDTVSCVLA